MIKLSIIVPIYNVEQYVFKCIESLYNQGLSDDSFEVIIVNDGTTDASMEVVSRFATQHRNIVIVCQENQGLSVARNNGLNQAMGDYVMFVDSDDFLIDNSLATLLPKAIESSPDMLIANYVKMTNDEIKQFTHINDNEFCETILMSGREAFLNFFNPNECYVWRTIYRREFLKKNHLSFIPSLYFEDIPFTTECYLKVEKALLFPQPLYVYRIHQNSIVNSINKDKLLDLNRIIEHLWKMLYTENLSNSDFNKMKDIIFTTFSIEMWFMSHKKGVFPYRIEIIEDLKKKIPNLFFSNSPKQFLISILYKCNPYLYLWIRSLIQ